MMCPPSKKASPTTPRPVSDPRGVLRDMLTGGSDDDLLDAAVDLIIADLDMLRPHLAVGNYGGQAESALMGIQARLQALVQLVTEEREEAEQRAEADDDSETTLHHLLDRPDGRVFDAAVAHEKRLVERLREVRDELRVHRELTMHQAAAADAGTGASS